MILPVVSSTASIESDQRLGPVLVAPILRGNYKLSPQELRRSVRHVVARKEASSCGRSFADVRAEDRNASCFINDHLWHDCYVEPEVARNLVVLVQQSELQLL